MDASSTQQHGDSIIDRYIPNASIEEREEARENLRRLARFLIGVHERRAEVDNSIRAETSAMVESASLSRSV
jgi:hypothetical protein